MDVVILITFTWGKEVPEMEKRIRGYFNYVMLALVIIGLLITLLIVYKNVDNPFANTFVLGYVGFLLISVLYSVVKILLNLKQLTKVEIRRRFLRCIIFTAVLGTALYIMDYMFRPENINLLRNFSIAFGSAFGALFFDLFFLKGGRQQ